MIAQSKLHILFTKQEIEATINRLASEIRKDFHDKHPLLIGILKGSFVFMADLVRLLDFPLEVAECVYMPVVTGSDHCPVGIVLEI